MRSATSPVTPFWRSLASQATQSISPLSFLGGSSGGPSWGGQPKAGSPSAGFFDVLLLFFGSLSPVARAIRRARTPASWPARAAISTSSQRQRDPESAGGPFRSRAAGTLAAAPPADWRSSTAAA